MKWRQGGGLLWFVVLPSWASLGYGCFDTETRAVLFFFSSPPGSPCGLTLPCSVLLLATGARLKGGAVEEERGPALTKRGVA